MTYEEEYNNYYYNNNTKFAYEKYNDYYYNKKKTKFVLVTTINGFTFTSDQKFDTRVDAQCLADVLNRLNSQKVEVEEVAV